MGKRGPAPTPTPLKLLRGETRPSRVGTGEPQPLARHVEPPDWLAPAAAAVWRDNATELTRLGLLTDIDRDTFAVYCDAVAQYREASEIIAKTGVLIRGRRDALVKSPAMQIVRDTASVIRAFGCEFGMTPSARVGLSSAENDDVNAAARLLS